MSRPCSMNGEMKNACKIVVVKPKGMRPLARHRRILEDILGK